MEQRGSTVLIQNAFCPHCSNISPQRLLYTHTFDETRPYDKSFDFAPGEGPCHRYFLATCSTCQDVLLYVSTYDPCEPQQFHKSYLVYPAGVSLHPSVPETIRACYDDAKRIQHNSPRSFALMLRSGLEAICDEQEVKKGSLKSRLDDLVSRGVIPPVLAEMTWVLRTLGNEAAHERKELSVYTTWILDDFFKAVVEYVYVAPSKLADFEERLEEAESEPST